MRFRVEKISIDSYNLEISQKNCPVCEITLSKNNIEEFYHYLASISNDSSITAEPIFAVEKENDAHVLEIMLNSYSDKVRVNNLWDLPDEILTHIDPMFKKSPLCSFLKRQIDDLMRKVVNLERLLNGSDNHNEDTATEDSVEEAIQNLLNTVPVRNNFIDGTLEVYLSLMPSNETYQLAEEFMLSLTEYAIKNGCDGFVIVPSGVSAIRIAATEEAMEYCAIFPRTNLDQSDQERYWYSRFFPGLIDQQNLKPVEGNFVIALDDNRCMLNAKMIERSSEERGMFGSYENKPCLELHGTFSIENESSKVSIDVRIMAGNCEDLYFAAFVEELNSKVVNRGRFFKSCLFFIRNWWIFESHSYLPNKKPVHHMLSDTALTLMLCAVFSKYDNRLHNGKLIRISCCLHALGLLLAEMARFDPKTHIITVDGFMEISTTNDTEGKSEAATHYDTAGDGATVGRSIVVELPQTDQLVPDSLVNKYWKLFHLDDPNSSQLPNRNEKIIVHPATENDTRSFIILHPFTHQNVCGKISAADANQLCELFRSAAIDLSTVLGTNGSNTEGSDAIRKFFSTILSQFENHRRTFQVQGLRWNIMESPFRTIWSNVLIANFLQHSIISDTAILRYCEMQVAAKGALTLSSLDKLLCTHSGVPKLTNALTAKFGGLKEYLTQLTIISNIEGEEGSAERKVVADYSGTVTNDATMNAEIPTHSGSLEITRLSSGEDAISEIFLFLTDRFGVEYIVSWHMLGRLVDSKELSLIKTKQKISSHIIRKVQEMAAFGKSIENQQEMTSFEALSYLDGNTRVSSADGDSRVKDSDMTAARNETILHASQNSEIQNSQEIDYFSPSFDFRDSSISQPTLKHNQERNYSYQEYDATLDSANIARADFSAKSYSRSPSNFDLVSLDSDLPYGVDSVPDARINSYSNKRFTPPLLIGPRPAGVLYGKSFHPTSAEYEYPQTRDNFDYVSSSARQNPIPYPYPNSPSVLPATHHDVRHLTKRVPTSTSEMIEGNDALLHMRYPQKQTFHGNANPYQRNFYGDPSNLYYSSGARSRGNSSSWTADSYSHTRPAYRSGDYSYNLSSQQTFSHQNYYSQGQEPTQPLFRNRVYDTTRQYKKPEERDMKTARLVFDKSKVENG